MQVRIQNLFIALLKTVNSPKAMCRYYSIYCVVSLPKLHWMLLVSVSLLACRTVPQVQQGKSTVRFTSRMDFQRRRLQNSEVSNVQALYILLINMGIDMGHDARTVSGFDRGLMGRGQVIQKLQDPSGRFVWAAGSDPRADGHAAAQI
jgi:gamma-glutamyltranspeptidase